jgi:hypothetical protein
MPDLIAELAGYRAEQARYAREGRTDRAAAVREQAAKVAATIGVEADKLDAKAGGHEDDGQDLLAVRARIGAKRLRAALADLGEPEAAVDATPRETATPKRGRA